METLLPSEVARLVLGYLEEEKCEEAAKCFLNTSPNLSEHRLLALKGRRYPTKVNGFSLKEALEEYCQVHSIVEESLSSMIEQPAVGNSMIDKLRFLVRACQPVQVHINLHTQQGQNSVNPPESPDSVVIPSRPRSRKNTLPSGQPADNSESKSNAQSGFPVFQPNSPAGKLPNMSINDHSLSEPNCIQQQCEIASGTLSENAQSVHCVNENVDITSAKQSDSCIGQDNHQVFDQKQSHQDTPNNHHQSTPQEAFHNIHQETYHKPSLLMPVQNFPRTPLESQNLPLQQPLSNSHFGGDISQISTNQCPLSQESDRCSFPLDSESHLANPIKIDEPVCSYSVTKCYGSSIVILDDSSSACQTSQSSSITSNCNDIQVNSDFKRTMSRQKLTDPIKQIVQPGEVCEGFTQVLLENNEMITKIVESINKVRTPAKEPEVNNTSTSPEDPKAYMDFVMQDEQFDQFFNEYITFNVNEKLSSIDELEGNILDGSKSGKKTKRVSKKRITSGSNISKVSSPLETSVCHPESNSSKELPDISTPLGLTPAKVMTMADNDSLTPMSKLLKSITSPSGELYLDPSQYPNFIEIPQSAIKVNPSEIEATNQSLQPYEPQPSYEQPSHQSQLQPESQPLHDPKLKSQQSDKQLLTSPNDGRYNKILQLPQPNGTTMSVPILFCNSNQQVAQYVNEKGVSTICEIQVKSQPNSTQPNSAQLKQNYVPIIPKLTPGQPIPAALFDNIQVNEAPQKSKHKRVLTRGGRRAAGQMHPTCSDMAVKEPNLTNVVTMYAADCRGDGMSSTVTVSDSQDLPSLMSDSADEVKESLVLSCKITGSNLSANTAVQVGGAPKHTESLAATAEAKNDHNQRLSSVVAGCNLITNSISREDGVLASIVGDRPSDGPLPNFEDKSEAKEDEGNLLPSNSLIRSTPDFRGAIRPQDKRTSFSTPRRRLSHIRTLDFNTPPKENEMSLRRANTSPKNMSSNALSPNTTGHTAKSCLREGLFKPPSNGFQRTSKVKAHLFKSPEYAFNQSSGFKNPSAATTSTPQEPSSSTNSPLPRPSGAWDKVSGVGLIINSDVSPVKSSGPACKKEVFKSWDADLRCGLPCVEESTGTKRKRKIAVPTQKKTSKKNKKAKKLGGSIPPSEQGETLNQNNNLSSDSSDKSKNISLESENEMAKLIEQNLLDDSVEKSGTNKSPLKVSPLKLRSPTSSPRSELLDIEENIKAYYLEKDPSGKKSKVDGAVSDESSTPPSNKTDIDSKASQGSPESSQLVNLQTQTAVHANNNSVVSSFSVQSSVVVDFKEKKERQEDTVLKTKSVTSVSELFCSGGTERILISQDALKDSLFDTPMKENLANMIPQTPRILDPNSGTNEDTPRTKIIKALPFPPVSSAENSIQTPTVPATPTIPSTSSSSPIGPPYFQSLNLSTSHSPLKELVDKSLESILIQECTRIEADGMREGIKKAVCTSQDIPTCQMEGDCPAESSKQLEVEHNRTSMVSSQTDEECNASKSSRPSKEVEEKSDENADVPAEEMGCARLKVVKRKTEYPDVEINSSQVCRLSSKKVVSSGDETEISLLPSPQKIPHKSVSPSSCQAKSSRLPTNSDGVQSSTIGTTLSASTPILHKTNTTEMEVISNVIHSKKRTLSRSVKSVPEPTSRLLRSPKKMPLSPVVQSATPDKKRVNVEASSATAADNLDKLLEAAPIRAKGKTVSSVTNVESSSAKILKKKTETKADISESISEGEQSSSSSSSSSSESESESSSTSEEGTPVKENVSPKHTNVRKTRSQCAAEKCQRKTQNDLVLDSSENVETLNFNPEEEKEVLKAKDLTEELVGVQTTDLKLQEKDNCDEIKSQSETVRRINADKSCSLFSSENVNFFHELQLKRTRTLEHLKNNTVPLKKSKSFKDKTTVKTDTTETSASPESLQKEVVEEDEQITKGLESIQKLPKKRKSTSERDAISTDLVTKEKDNKLSDEDDEFKLHLSGDEKEETAQKSLQESVDPVEMQIAALHSESSLDLEMPQNPIKQMSIGVKKVLSSAKSKAPKTRSREPPELPLKVPSKCWVSSESADKVLKSLVEKGLGHSLISPPSDKIRKLGSNLDKVAQEESKKSINQVLLDSVTSPKQDQEIASSYPTNSTLDKPLKQPRKTCMKSNHVIDDQDEEPFIEVINTGQRNHHEVRIVYNGLAPKISEKEICSVQPFYVELEGGDRAFTYPSKFFNLFSAAPSNQTVYRTIRTSINGCSSKKTYRENTEMRSEHKSPDRKARGRQEDRRPRKNRSPSPAHRRSRDYLFERNCSRNSHRSHDRRGQSRSTLKRYEDLREKRYSEAESRSSGHIKHKTNSKSKEDVEEGEILSSDFEVEENGESRNFHRSVKERSSEMRSRERRTSLPEKRCSNPERRKQNSKRSSAIAPTRHHRIILNSSPERQRQHPRQCSNSEESKPGQADTKMDQNEHRSPAFSDDDADLDDDIAFPVLGEEDIEDDPKGIELDEPHDSDQTGITSRRRAPPRLVNAHKTNSVDKSTPVLRRKRKLSPSVEDLSEESYQSSLCSSNPEPPQGRPTRRRRKTLSNLDTPALKAVKSNVCDSVGDSTEIIKNLDVESFLAKIHG